MSLSLIMLYTVLTVVTLLSAFIMLVVVMIVYVGDNGPLIIIGSFLLMCMLVFEIVICLNVTELISENWDLIHQRQVEQKIEKLATELQEMNNETGGR